MRVRPLAFVLAVALLFGCSGGPSPADRAATTAGATAPTMPALHPSVDGYGTTALDVAGTPLVVLVADTPAERRHGLMDVEHLPDGVGMLFVYAGNRTGGFWMKDTLVPLSIAFLDADGRILEILDMAPCPPDATACPTYRPEHAYRYALEVPRDWFGRVGVRPGDRVTGLPGRSAV